MLMKQLNLKKLALLGFFVSLWPCSVKAMDYSPLSFPNSHPKSFLTPTGWGASNGTVFLAAGITSPAPYSNKTDGGIMAGVGIGNPYDSVGLQVGVVNYDLSDWERIGVNLHLHRYLGSGSSIAIGAENLMITGADLTDADESYYVVFSQGLLDKVEVNKETSRTKLHYSIGIGKGRFSEKSPDDVADGKGKDGTWVFGNIAYELFDECNIICEWDGRNLSAALGKTFFISNSVPVAVTVGLADLTDNSGDGVRFIAGISTALWR
ncbi:MAG TPA: hypothetical protein ENL07_03670 [Chlorobaculum parvum]|uniref:Uncharacterized protein n=1 Tax=Chlorobaculum parvum TaxID=274539 RepID=A0A7C5DHY1_9CHLB|nr:hypothetical protein [Chlorobaculum parvum]